MTRFPLLAVLVAVLMTVVPSASAQNLPLEDGARVFDETGSSLSAAQTADLERRVAALQQVGAEGVVLVRAKDASPKETLKQVERLQQDFKDDAGVPEETAYAILYQSQPRRSEGRAGGDLRREDLPGRQRAREGAAEDRRRGAHPGPA